MVRSGRINLRFEGNQASFEDDNGVTWVYNPPSSCSLLLTPYIQVQTGRWRFDILPDGNDAAKTLLTGQLSQEQQLITVSGEPALQGLLVGQNTWVVQAGPEFSIRGQFKETPANPFQGTYTRGDQSGQVFGYRLRSTLSIQQTYRLSDVWLGPDIERHTLVKLLGHHIENILAAGTRSAPSLIGDKREWCRLIEQA
jgi:hypothetical protein